MEVKRTSVEREVSADATPLVDQPSRAEFELNGAGSRFRCERPPVHFTAMNSDQVKSQWSAERFIGCGTLFVSTPKKKNIYIIAGKHKEYLPKNQSAKKSQEVGVTYASKSFYPFVLSFDFDFQTIFTILQQNMAEC